MHHIKALAVILAMLIPTGAMAQTLTGGEWRVVDLAGGALPEGVSPTLTFAAEGRVAGHSGCNRFTGSWAQDGTALTFGAMASTRMACDAPRMETETRMLEALGTVTSVALTPGGALELLGPGGLIIHAVR